MLITRASLINRPQNRLQKTGKFEALEKLANTRPIDRKVNIKEDLMFDVGTTGTPSVLLKPTGEEYILGKKAYAQLAYFLHPKLHVALLDAMPVTEANSLINGFINRSNNEVLFRSTPNNYTVGVVSKTYKPVNHEILIETIEQVPEEVEFEAFINYETAIIRAAVKKISSEGLGIWSGINFVNGQIGNYALNISALLWEKVCTNGAVITIDKFVYYRGRHTKHMQMPNGSILSWFTDVSNRVKNIYEEARYVEISRNYIEKMPKRFSLVTQTLADEYIRYIAMRTHQPSNFENTTLWALMQAVTQTSQRFAPERRLQLDSFISELLSEHRVNAIR